MMLDKAKEKPLSYEEINHALLYVSDMADSYEDWIKIGTAIKAWEQEHPDNSGGMLLWDSWSSRSSKYKGPPATAKAWYALKPTSVSVGFLVSCAFRRGWQRERPQKTSLVNANYQEPDKNDHWREKVCAKIAKDFEQAPRMLSWMHLPNAVLAGYMRFRGVDLLRTNFPYIESIPRLSITKEKQHWSGVIAEIRDCLGDHLGYHVIFLQNITPIALRDRSDCWMLRKAPIKKEDQKKTYRLPKKTPSHGGVWLHDVKPCIPYTRLAICEGIETMLALYILGGMGGEYAFLRDAGTQLVASPAMNMPKLTIPLGIETVDLFTDIEPSQTGLKQSAAMAARLQKEGLPCNVYIPNKPEESESWDWHDEVAEKIQRAGFQEQMRRYIRSFMNDKG